MTRSDPVAVFTLMQPYRNIQGPHGVVAGPHRDSSMKAVEGDLKRLGATVV
ncbi:MAG TPA: hypothetical protein VF862_06260 [Gemmatimonadales bacterium]